MARLATRWVEHRRRAGRAVRTRGRPTPHCRRDAPCLCARPCVCLCACVCACVRGRLAVCTHLIGRHSAAICDAHNDLFGQRTEEVQGAGLGPQAPAPWTMPDTRRQRAMRRVWAVYCARAPCAAPPSRRSDRLSETLASSSGSNSFHAHTVRPDADVLWRQAVLAIPLRLAVSAAALMVDCVDDPNSVTSILEEPVVVQVVNKAPNQEGSSGARLC